VVDEEGRICAYIESQVNGKGKKITNPRLLHVLKTQIKEPTLQVQNGQFGLGFISNTDKGNWHEVFVPAVSMKNQSTLIGALLTYWISDNPTKRPRPCWKVHAQLDRQTSSDGHSHQGPGTLGWRYENGERWSFTATLIIRRHQAAAVGHDR
jgi:hypothetical protein